MVANSETLMMHATCVVVSDKGVLIKGASGSGKSGLALQLIALGAILVADDQTLLTRREGELIANAPSAIAGLIEARGIGLIALPFATDVAVTLVVDLDLIECIRLPTSHTQMVMDMPLPCLHKVDAPHFPSAVMAVLRGHRKDPDADILQ